MCNRFEFTATLAEMGYLIEREKVSSFFVSISIVDCSGNRHVRDIPVRTREEGKEYIRTIADTLMQRFEQRNEVHRITHEEEFR